MMEICVVVVVVVCEAFQWTLKVLLPSDTLRNTRDSGREPPGRNYFVCGAITGDLQIHRLWSGILTTETLYL